MQILESMHKSLPILGMSSSQSIQKHPFNARNVASFLIYGINSICNVGFLIFGANNLMEFIDSLYLTVTAVLAVLILINLSWQMRQLFEFLKHIEDTVERRLEHPVSKTIYTKTHENIQKVVKISMFAFPGMTPFVVTIPPFIVSFSTYFTTDLGPEVLELPLPMWFPFEVQNPIGYSIAVCLEYLFTLNLELLTMSIMVIAIGPCLILISMTKDLKYNLHILDISARLKEDPVKIVRDFSEFIQLHSNAKQLVVAFSNTMEFVFATLFSWSIGSICSTMLMMKMELQQGASNSLLLQRCNELLISIALVFICCEFGHKLSKAFEEIDDAIGKMNWYEFPVPICKILPTVISGAQEPTVLSVFGSVSCTRENFKMVFNSAFSYFMVLRQFDY